jgi:Fe2+ or Zn2+ uptake regulation protein
MTLEANKGSTITFCCDECGEILDTDTDDFDEARGILRSERWKTKKIDKDWVHFCPGCANMESM